MPHCELMQMIADNVALENNVERIVKINQSRPVAGCGFLGHTETHLLLSNLSGVLFINKTNLACITSQLRPM